jgi:DNA-binding NtrC family response regulator
VVFKHQSLPEPKRIIDNVIIGPYDSVQLSEPEETAMAADPPTPERILLLVDDEPAILSSLSRLLRNEGYRILTAENGLAALNLMANHDVGVVVSDGLMAQMTGAEFLMAVKERYPRAVRILLTGFTEPGVVLQAIQQCALFSFQSKPWDNDELRKVIRSAFRRHEASGAAMSLESAYHHG